MKYLQLSIASLVLPSLVLSSPFDPSTPFDSLNPLQARASKNGAGFQRFSSPFPFYPENSLSGGKGCRSEPIEAGFHNATLKTLDTADNSTGEMIERTHLVYVPEIYDGTQALPTLMAFHGSGSSAQQLVDTSELKKMADENAFIVSFGFKERED